MNEVPQQMDMVELVIARTLSRAALLPSASSSLLLSHLDLSDATVYEPYITYLFFFFFFFITLKPRLE